MVKLFFIIIISLLCYIKDMWLEEQVAIMHGYSMYSYTVAIYISILWSIER